MSAIAGIDYSITGPSVCIHPKDKAWSLSNCEFLTINGVKKTHGVWNAGCKITVIGPIKDYIYDIERHDITANIFKAFLLNNNVTTVMFEGYAFAAAGKVFNLAEATGLMKQKIVSSGITMLAHTPPVFKKYATTKGNANKDKMFDAFLQDTGVNLSKTFNQDKIRAPVDNLVDSYWVCKYLYENFPGVSNV